MRGPIVLSILALLSMQFSQAKDKPEWKTAKVVFAKHDLFSDGPIASMGRGGPGGSNQTARQRFDLETGDAIYTVEWSCLPSQRLRLSEGDSVELAVDGKRLLLTRGTADRGGFGSGYLDRSVMELIQGARSKPEIAMIRRFLKNISLKSCRSTKP